MNWNREGTRFSKFLVVGTIGAIVDFSTFNLLTLGAVTFNLHILVLGITINNLSIVGPHLPPVPSSMISFLAAVTSNFFFNRYWTYPDSRSKPIWHQALQFTAVNAIGLGIRTPLFAVLMPVWRSVLESARVALYNSGEQLSRNLALGCAVVVVLIWNFVVNRFWTYNDVQ